MTKPIIRIHDLSTDEIIDREMNDEEFAGYEASQLEQIAADKARAKSAADKAALLVRLGLTEDELKTILG
jgi:hypothetical protein